MNGLLLRFFRKTGAWVAPMLVLFAFSSLTPDVAIAQGSRAQAAQPVRATANRVGVEIMVVHATTSPKPVDPRLKDIMKQLQFTNFKGFKLLNEQDAQLADGGDVAVNVAGGRKLKVQLLSHNDASAKLRIRMFKEGNKILDTTVNIRRNKAFLIGGPNFQGGKLVLPITVKY